MVFFVRTRKLENVANNKQETYVKNVDKNTI